MYSTVLRKARQLLLEFHIYGFELLDYLVNCKHINENELDDNCPYKDKTEVKKTNDILKTVQNTQKFTNAMTPLIVHFDMLFLPGARNNTQSGFTLVSLG